MKNQYLSTLSRGIGIQGDAYEDHKPRYPYQIPYSLCDLSFKTLNKNICVDKSKKKAVPGTYLTETGQVLLYTRIKKREGLVKQTSLICKNLCDLYNAVSAVQPTLQADDIHCTKNRSTLGLIPESIASLQNNWFFPQKWKSPAKELLPLELMNNSESFVKFMQAKQSYPINFNMSNAKEVEKMERLRETQLKKILPYIKRKNKQIWQQRQNNAVQSSSVSDTSEISISSPVGTTISLSESFEYDTVIPKESLAKNDQLQISKSDNANILSSGEYYESEENLVIHLSKHKTIEAIGDSDDGLSDNPCILKISEALGDESLVPKTKKVQNADPNIHQPERLTARTRNTEDLRCTLLKDLYKELHSISHIRVILKDFGELLLSQFQEFNIEKRKLRIRKNKEEIYRRVKEMKDRNDEITHRLNRASQKQLLDKKNSLDKSEFLRERDKMLLNMSIKSKRDNIILEEKIGKLVTAEEIRLRQCETEIVNREHSSIKFAYTKLRNELVKIDEKRQEMDHFVIRLEMRRENVSKIEREIEIATPPICAGEKYDLVNFIKEMKSEIVSSWLLKMYDLASDFKMNEKKLLELIKSIHSSDSNLESESIQSESGENVNLNASTHEINMENCKNFKRNIGLENEMKPDSKETKGDFNTVQILVPFKDKQEPVHRVEYEMLKQSQKVSSSFSNSYFTSWPRHTYEKYQEIDSETSEEEKSIDKEASKKRLNYKRILAYNPLLKRQLKKKLSKKC